MNAKNKRYLLTLLLLSTLVLCYGCGSKSTHENSPAMPSVAATQIVTQGSDPFVSPNGSRLIYRTSSGWFLRDSVGTTRAVLRPDSVQQVIDAIQWFPDNNRILFAAHGEPGTDMRGLFIYNTSTSEYERIRSSGRSPSLAANGSRVAFEDSTGNGIGVFSMVILSRIVTELLTPANHPSISPDGQNVAMRGGPVGRLPVLVSVNAPQQSVTLAQYDCASAAFKSANVLVFDGYLLEQERLIPTIFEYVLGSAHATELLRYSTSPVASTNGWVTYRVGTSTVSEVRQLRDGVEYLIGASVGSFTATSGGRVAFELNGGIWYTN